MNKLKFKLALTSELKKLNHAIDLKIARGLPYHTEARRHRVLLRQINGLSKEKAFAFF